ASILRILNRQIIRTLRQKNGGNSSDGMDVSIAHINLEDREEDEDENATEANLDEHDVKFKEVTALFREKVAAARKKKEKIEKDTVEKARELIGKMESLVENEKNIGKAFSGFSDIQESWKSLPKVSNDAYRDLNAEYNKIVELFFYNINIYKELKELDLKHNLEQKQLVLEDQKKLLDMNDIRLLEVEVRLNQERWNEIGPTFKEEWDAIKDEFWNITREIYKRIQDFYNARKEEQVKNLEKKKELLARVEQLANLDLKSQKKWREKTKDVIDIQKQWKMIGFVPKEDASALWKEFRSTCDKFFDRKRAYFDELHKEQDANRDAKEKLVEQAEALKDDTNWKETSSVLINLQKKWKEIGPAHQRDENKLWRKFRAACDQFFQARKGQKQEETAEFKNNLEKKEALLKELESFEPTDDRNKNVETLKAFGAKWRDIGHVPFKVKDKVNKKYSDLMDTKFSALKIDKSEKEKIRFEQKLENMKSGDDDRMLRKEQDHIRNKISKLKSEIVQFENNMGFFADSKGADKLKKDVEKKVERAQEEIEMLKERLMLLRDV
ncbi:MAG: DUF349 domain-containing protein, partial [Flavobacteriales bacterium]|nr:DUF349 domain-containing protein [Flavobacteriales bacterium]